MELSIAVNVVVFITLLVLTLGFLFYRRILNLSLVFVKVLFVISLFTALITLLFPQLYTNFVESRFSETILAKDLISIDNTLTQVSRVQISISNTLNSFLNTGSQEILEEYESSIYMQTIDFMAGALRVIMLILSIVILIFTLYIRYSFSGSFEVISLQKQINELKKEIEILKLSNVKAS